MKIEWEPWGWTSYTKRHFVDVVDRDSAVGQYTIRFRRNARNSLFYDEVSILVRTNHPVLAARHIVESGEHPWTFKSARLLTEAERKHASEE